MQPALGGRVQVGFHAGGRRGWAGPELGKTFPLQPGRLKKVQGIGWYLDEKNVAQVSTNLLDFEVTALHTVYEEACREAQVSRTCVPCWLRGSLCRGAEWVSLPAGVKSLPVSRAGPQDTLQGISSPARADTDVTGPLQELSLPVVGSQLVGLVPLKALLDAAAFYCEKENLFLLEEEHRVRLVSWAPGGGPAVDGSKPEAPGAGLGHPVCRPGPTPPPLSVGA